MTVTGTVLSRAARTALAAWPGTPAEARALQGELAERVSLVDMAGRIGLVGGLDVHFSRDGRTSYAAAVLMEGEGRHIVESALAASPTTFPYVSGLLSFRETPVALRALTLLGRRPDLLLVDGQGIAHPRRFGLACHIGLLAGIPTIGVAKSRLIGAHAEPGPERGAFVPLTHKGETIGVVLRSKRNVRPLYVSPGHGISLPRAMSLTLAYTHCYRLPEPTRLADALSRCHG
ncbi:MAG: deoxyribonuclease V [Geminicoccaceae bacterium]|nr:deoxyribonuclease V [Geminicoccaceae bacterium]